MVTWLLQLALIVAACGCFGWLAQRLGQARVVGELAAGIVLGQGVLGAVDPSLQTALFGPAVSAGLTQLGEVGVIMLMFQIGLHLRLGADPRRTAAGAAPPAVKVAAIGMLLPLAGGCAIGWLSHDTLAPQVATLPYTLFCGVALSVSALPVMVRIVADTDLIGSPPSMLALSAAMLTDLAGWVMLAFVSAIAVAGADLSSAWRVVAGIAVFLVVSKLVVRLVVAPLAGEATRRDSPGALMAVVVPYVTVSAWATTAIGVHSAFGALLAAVMLRGVPGLQAHWERQIEGFVNAVLLPVFFVYSGLQVSFETFDGATQWGWLVPFLAVAFVGKFGGSYLGARWSGLPRRDAALVGSLMNTRGLVELVVLSAGLQMQALSQGAYAVLLLVALATTAMTTPFVHLWRRAALRPA
ncbi:cation:proton antiporter [Burkholderia glumae]|uniref:Cation:proton antiporter n=1 Tax=Burkholderia glumae TaxID=337 RepID=A0AAP9Y2U7_BURGL|nr:cation:proton antiporter [Burkholderia glumae]ACR28840.1 transporter, CPA2 family [Burkholderia glumae BGR1]AJY66207.1 sodium/hydrogen exchanger family protein [Burkholderia glumae LMG 2196 = ATCC 33617]MCM2483277.1 cation:proton antiporter [Burkholderia glumae]MCM2506594.1 cation:proton antiporter [Burkholderia glumae]MCM2538266.1 cation:proton antiporter [Burkholderia glumae]